MPRTPAFGEEVLIGDVFPEIPASAEPRSTWNVIGIRRDGTRQVNDSLQFTGGSTVDEPLMRVAFPDSIAIFWGPASVETLSRGGWFLPYPPSDGIPIPMSHDPVNQLPYLEGWIEPDPPGEAIVHRGWMADVCTFAHEALSWDDRQIQRLHGRSHGQAPDVAHTADSRKRAQLALQYGRILTGWVYNELAVWEKLDPKDTTTPYRNWKDRLSVMQWVMTGVCEVECSTPHWLLDFALTIDPDAWEDALAEQSEDQGSRRVFIPKILKSSEPWMPGSIGDTNQYYTIFNTPLNPLRFFEDQILRFAEAAERYRRDYAIRSHAPTGA